MRLYEVTITSFLWAIFCSRASGLTQICLRPSGSSLLKVTRRLANQNSKLLTPPTRTQLWCTPSQDVSTPITHSPIYLSLSVMGPFPYATWFSRVLNLNHTLNLNNRSSQIHLASLCSIVFIWKIITQFYYVSIHMVKFWILIEFWNERAPFLTVLIVVYILKSKFLILV